MHCQPQSRCAQLGADIAPPRLELFGATVTGCGDPQERRDRSAAVLHLLQPHLERVGVRIGDQFLVEHPHRLQRLHDGATDRQAIGVSVHFVSADPHQIDAFHEGSVRHRLDRHRAHCERAHLRKQRGISACHDILTRHRA
ncbi:MAG: hypothetical protein B7Y43_06530 [Sphingomonas sp. 28-62-20]|nr:MAG: hypothetical protein B7Y43_06530 [Sphingomonas sp. 28-62-20]